MKNVLIVITKAEIGGAQVSVLNLAKKLKERGLKVTIGSGKGQFLYQKISKENIDFIKFKHLARSYNPFQAILFALEMRKYLNKNNFDIVHFNSSNSLLGAIGAKIAKNRPKTVFTFRGMSFLDPNHKRYDPFKYIHVLIFKTLLTFIDSQVFVSKDNQVTGKSLRISKNDHVVYNGLNPLLLDFLESEKAKQILSDKINVDLTNKTIIGSIGRLAHQKNYEFLIKTAKEIEKINPQAVIVIIGDGPEKQQYQKLIKKHKVEHLIKLAGAIPDAYKYMKAFDIFALPSRYEGLSITLLEALFAGLPIITTDVGGNRETVADTKFIYTLDSEEEFLTKIKNLLLNKEKRNLLSKKSLEKSKDFTIDKTVEGYMKIYQS